MMSNVSQELDILSYIHRRRDLSVAQKQKQSNLSKGLEGEQQLYDLLKSELPASFIVLTDLLLAHNGTEFQMDIMLIGEDTVYVLEVKNYEGNFVIQKDNWYVASSRNEIRNPLHQLKRMEILLKNVLQQGTLHFSIESYIVFVHPEFYLYEAPLNLPLIFPTQINRFIRKLQSSSFNVTERHKKLDGYLESQRLSRSAHERLPQYEYKDLRKGIVCPECSRFLSYVNYKKVICRNCNHEEPLESAVKRSTIEFSTLFPNRKVTTSAIIDWCHIIKSRKTIRRILKKYLIAHGKGRYTYYKIRKERL